MFPPLLPRPPRVPGYLLSFFETRHPRLTVFVLLAGALYIEHHFTTVSLVAADTLARRVNFTFRMAHGRAFGMMKVGAACRALGETLT